MREFYAQRFNLLVCSTIIETGIDVPTANTIIIDRADRFGLAQLHQLRGRVGRSHHQAYAYLLTPPAGSAVGAGEEAPGGDPDDGGSRLGLLPRDARPRDPRRRRGARRGAVRARCSRSGFQLYADMLKRGGVGAEGRTRAGSDAAARRHHRDQPARARRCCRSDYCSDVHERLVLYKRLASCESQRRARPAAARSWSTASGPRPSPRRR